MKSFLLFALVTSSVVLSSAAFAGVSGIRFKKREIKDNAEYASLISEAAASCLQRNMAAHLKFHDQNKYSKFYGNRHPRYKTPEGRKEALMKILPELAAKVRAGDRAAIAELSRREKELQTTSCVGLALTCLEEGFRAAEMEDTWAKIWDYVGRQGEDGKPLFYGSDLQKALIDLGWKSIYWNPDLSKNESWDLLEREYNPLKEGKDWNPVWGGHAYRWALVKNTREYYGIPVQDIQTLVNFGVKTPEDFKRVPFFVGIAHAGYHVFPGFHGQVIEAHSMRDMASRENIEVGPFNPLFQPLNGVANGNGAPKWTNSEHYRSGMIVVPPGYIADKSFTVPPPAVDVPPNGTKPPVRP